MSIKNRFSSPNIILCFIGITLPLFQLQAQELPLGPLILKEEMTINTYYYIPEEDFRNYAIKPVPVDWDKDGDFDLVLGMLEKPIGYFENIGSSKIPEFVERQAEANPFNTIDTGFISYPELVDLDADGDFDLVLGVYPGVLRFFENIGTPTNAEFLEREGDTNPLAKIDVVLIDIYHDSGVAVNPIAIDIDNDEDFDFILETPASHTSSHDKRIAYIENIGTSEVPEFIQHGNSEPPTNILLSTLPEYSLPFVLSKLDFDNDGDMDLLMIRDNEDEPIFNDQGRLLSYKNQDSFTYFENLGRSSEVAFSVRETVGIPWLWEKERTFTSAWADLDADGDQDVILRPSVSTAGQVHFAENKNLSDYQRAFNWAESTFPSLFPSPIESFDSPPFKVHFYPSTGTYLGYNPEDNNAYWYFPPYQQIELLAPLDVYLEAVLRAGF